MKFRSLIVPLAAAALFGSVVSSHAVAAATSRACTISLFEQGAKPGTYESVWIEVRGAPRVRARITALCRSTTRSMRAAGLNVGVTAKPFTVAPIYKDEGLTTADLRLCTHRFPAGHRLSIYGDTPDGTFTRIAVQRLCS